MRGHFIVVIYYDKRFIPNLPRRTTNKKDNIFKRIVSKIYKVLQEFI
jgi:hypothetical protein